VSLEDFEHLRSLKGPILITGHTGFKGTWLTFLLAELGIKTYGLSLPAESGSMYDRLNLKGENPEVFSDIREQSETLRIVKDIEPSAIIHLAAQPLVLESYRSPVDTFNTNVMGTAHILDAASKVKSVKAVAVSTTDKVYLNDNLGIAFKEQSPLGGKDPYSASKVGTEQVIRAWQQISSSSEGPNILAMRAGNVIGGGDFAKDRLLPDLIRAAFFNEPTAIRNPRSTRPWQHVLDPLYGYLLFLECSLRGNKINALNFSTNKSSLSVDEVIKVFKSRFPNIQVEIREETTGYQESQLLDLDSSLANQELDWISQLTQQQAINQTIDWWEHHGSSEFLLESTKTEILHYLAMTKKSSLSS
jgi:CDP-glucose 4,6-dehydratase